MQYPRARHRQYGQSLVEFALSAAVLVLLFGGLVDLTRAIHDRDILASAVREGARRAATYNAASDGYPYLDDADIKTEVNTQLTAGGLANVGTVNQGGNCPSVADGNAEFNPPYANSAFHPVANQPYLYVCYDNGVANEDYPSTQSPPLSSLAQCDVNVILIMAYGPLTAVIPTPLSGNFGLSANWHAWVRGPTQGSC